MREQIPEGGAKNRKVVREAEYATLDRDDERRGYVEDEKQSLNSRRAGEFYSEIPERQLSLRSKECPVGPFRQALFSGKLAARQMKS